VTFPAIVFKPLHGVDPFAESLGQFWNSLRGVGREIVNAGRQDRTEDNDWTH